MEERLGLSMTVLTLLCLFSEHAQLVLQHSQHSPVKIWLKTVFTGKCSIYMYLAKVLIESAQKLSMKGSIDLKIQK